jgi:oligopeptide transport system substrate-binding protein
MEKRYRLLMVILAVFLLPAFFATTASAEKKIVWAQPNDVTTHDRQTGSLTDDQNVNCLYSEGLVRVHNGKILPGIAESWDIRNNGQTYIFHLRKSVWHDGKPVTAHDFEYTFKRLVDPKTGSRYAIIADVIKNAVPIIGNKMPPSDLGVKALDDSTLQIDLEYPADFFLLILNSGVFYPVNPDYVKKYGKEYASSPDKLEYNGPFILKEHKNEESNVLVKNPNYWNAKAVKLDKIEMLVIPDENTALTLFENGNIDLAKLPATLFDKYSSRAIATGGNPEWMYVNTRRKTEKPWLGNKNFIKAIGFGIDRQEYADLASRGRDVPLTRFVLPILTGKNATYGEDYPLSFFPARGDKAEAQKYLAMALKELNLKSPSDISVDYQVRDDPESRRAGEAMQSILAKNLGIKVNVTPVDNKRIWASMNEGTFDLSWAAYAADYDSPYSYLTLIYSSHLLSRRTGYSNKEFDSLFDTIKSTSGKDNILRKYYEAEKVLMADTVPIVPVKITRAAYLANPKLKGVVFSFVNFQFDLAFADKE